MKELIAIIITVLGLVAVASVKAQVGFRTGSVSYDSGMRQPIPTDPLQGVSARESMTLRADLAPRVAHYSDFVEIQYDQGEAVGASGGNHLFYALGVDVRSSTRFAPKTSSGDDREVRIDRIWLAPYFDNQFGNTSLPASAPRDLTVYIYSDQGGKPDTVLFSKVIEDPRIFAQVSSYTLDFFELDLSNEGVGVLPDVVHIAYGNAGSDENDLVSGPAPYATENVSHLYLPSRSEWVPLWSVEVESGISFNETVVPIRARFSLASPPAPLQFANVVADQSLARGQSITPLVLPEATGGVPPISYALTPALPVGLSFDSSTRTISGTPTEITAAPVAYTFTATDADGTIASLQFNIEVYARVHFAQGVADQSFPRAQPIVPLILPEVAGGVPPISYSLSPGLLTGLGFISSTRTISGTPTEVTAAPVRFTFTAIDSTGDAASLQFNIEVYSPVRIEQETLPGVFVLYGNYPNPFRQSTRLVFDLPRPARVTVEVMDIVGRRVLTVPPIDIAAGWQNHVVLDGQSLPPGHYLYRIIVSSAEGSSTQTGHFVRFR